MTMKLGIHLDAQHPAFDDPARRFAETVEQARPIRAPGFDSIRGGEPVPPRVRRHTAAVRG